MWSAFLLGVAVSLAANVAAAPAAEWQPVFVAGWPPVALLLSVEPLVHRPVGRLDLTAGQPGQGDGHARSKRLYEDDDPLLPRARMVDAWHRELHQRPVSAETLRKELRIGARRSRQLAAIVRGVGVTAARQTWSAIGQMNRTVGVSIEPWLLLRRRRVTTALESVTIWLTRS